MGFYDRVKGSYYKNYESKLASRKAINITLSRLRKHYETQVLLVKNTLGKVLDSRDYVIDKTNDIEEMNKKIKDTKDSWDSVLTEAIKKKTEELQTTFEEGVTGQVDKVTVNPMSGSTVYSTPEEWERAQESTPNSVNINWFGGKFDAGQLRTKLSSILRIVKINQTNGNNLEEYNISNPIMEFFIKTPKGITWIKLGKNGLLGHGQIIKYHSPGTDMKFKPISNLFGGAKDIDIFNTDIDTIVDLCLDNVYTGSVYFKIKTNLPYSVAAGMGGYFLAPGNDSGDFSWRKQLQNSANRQLLFNNLDYALHKTKDNSLSEVLEEITPNFKPNMSFYDKGTIKNGLDNKEPDVLGYASDITLKSSEDGITHLANSTIRLSDHKKVEGFDINIGGLTIGNSKDILVKSTLLDNSVRHNKKGNNSESVKYIDGDNIYDPTNYRDIGLGSLIVHNELMFEIDKNLGKVGSEVIAKNGKVSNDSNLLTPSRITSNIINDNAIDFYSTKNSVINTNFFDTPLKLEINCSKINDIKKTSGGIFISTDNGVYTIDEKTWSLKATNITSGNFSFIAEGKYGIYLGSNDFLGIYRWDKNNERFIQTNITEGNFPSYFVRNGEVFAISNSGYTNFDEVAQTVNISKVLFKEGIDKDTRNIRFFDTINAEGFLPGGGNNALQILQLANSKTIKIIYFDPDDKFYIYFTTGNGSMGDNGIVLRSKQPNKFGEFEVFKLPNDPNNLFNGEDVRITDMIYSNYRGNESIYFAISDASGVFHSVLQYCNNNIYKYSTNNKETVGSNLDIFRNVCWIKDDDKNVDDHKNIYEYFRDNSDSYKTDRNYTTGKIDIINDKIYCNLFKIDNIGKTGVFKCIFNNRAYHIIKENEYYGSYKDLKLNEIICGPGNIKDIWEINNYLFIESLIGDKIVLVPDSLSKVHMDHISDTKRDWKKTIISSDAHMGGKITVNKIYGQVVNPLLKDENEYNPEKGNLTIIITNLESGTQTRYIEIIDTRLWEGITFEDLMNVIGYLSKPPRKNGYSLQRYKINGADPEEDKLYGEDYSVPIILETYWNRDIRVTFRELYDRADIELSYKILDKENWTGVKFRDILNDANLINKPPVRNGYSLKGYNYAITQRESIFKFAYLENNKPNITINVGNDLVTLNNIVTKAKLNDLPTSFGDYNFMGYYNEEDPTETIIPDTEILNKVDGPLYFDMDEILLTNLEEYDVEIIAIWSENKSFAIRYLENNKSDILVSFDIDSDVTLDAILTKAGLKSTPPTLSGYQLVGYYKDGDSTETILGNSTVF